MGVTERSKIDESIINPGCDHPQCYLFMGGVGEMRSTMDR